ncbi:hypothetical protein [Methylomonas sp. 11b]
MRLRLRRHRFYLRAVCRLILHFLTLRIIPND